MKTCAVRQSALRNGPGRAYHAGGGVARLLCQHRVRPRGSQGNAEAGRREARRGVRQGGREPANRKSLLDQGADPVGGTPEAHDAYIKSEVARWRKVTKEAGITPE